MKMESGYITRLTRELDPTVHGRGRRRLITALLGDEQAKKVDIRVIVIFCFFFCVFFWTGFFLTFFLGGFLGVFPKSGILGYITV